MGRSRIPGSVKNKYRVPFEKRTAQRQNQATGGTILKHANRVAQVGSNLTWGDSGDNITVEVAVSDAGRSPGTPSQFMGYCLWDTGYTVADMPSMEMQMTRVVSPEAQVLGPPVMVYGFTVDDAVGNVTFASGGSSTCRWGGVRWGSGSNGENNQLTSTLRANQNCSYSGNLSLKSGSPTSFTFKQKIQYVLRKEIDHVDGTAGDILTSSTYSESNYPGTNGDGNNVAYTKNNSVSSAITATDKIFWFIGFFRHGDTGDAAVDLEFKMVAKAMKGFE